MYGYKKYWKYSTHTSGLLNALIEYPVESPQKLYIVEYFKKNFLTSYATLHLGRGGFPLNSPCKSPGLTWRFPKGRLSEIWKIAGNAILVVFSDEYSDLIYKLLRWKMSPITYSCIKWICIILSAKSKPIVKVWWILFWHFFELINRCFIW